MLILGSHSFYYSKVAQQIQTLLPDRSCRMLLIGLAADEDFAASILRREVNSLGMAGFDRSRITVFEPASAEAAMQQDYSYIAVLGGNTFRLLHQVCKFGLDSFIREQFAKGAHYMGFSAGAYLACPDIFPASGLDDNNDITDGDLTALHLTDDYVFCHYGEDDLHDARRLQKLRYQLGDRVTVHPIGMDDVLVL